MPFPSIPIPLICALIARGALLTGLLWIAHTTTEISTSVTLLSLSLWVGTVAGSILSVGTLTTRGIITATAVVAVIGAFVLSPLLPALYPVLGTALDASALSYSSAIDHFALTGVVGLVLTISTALVLRWGLGAPLEVIVLVLLTTSFLQGHREFHLDQPQIIDDYAWALGISPLLFFVTLGSVLTATVCTYLVIASYAYDAVGPSISGAGGRSSRALGSADYIRKEPRSRTRTAIGVVSTVAVLGVLVGFVGWSLHQHFMVVTGSKLSNGVGQTTDEGTSPLGFHSALGATKQPSALVRFENDYAENPLAPLLYLREAALSTLRENELVLADPKFDVDTPRISPDERFSTNRIKNPQFRSKITQSIYLMSSHKTAFAVDYGVSFAPLVNPDPERFVGAYRAVSLAPTFAISDLRGRSVGDPTWTKEVREHYLQPHPDPRYGLMAQKITAASPTPIGKAAAMIQYLSKNAIYTLEPNHQVSEDEDQVAPFLFGDLRGYCVHFAHATVYMLRSLGIPSRIGTGYMTDMGQAKDGHMLLRMNDRHAWAEVYVDGIGWVPFDTQPEKVESHAASEVDSSMLEELMGLLDPGEEIIPPEEQDPSLSGSDKSKSTLQIPLPSFGTLSAIVGALATLLLILKLVLRYGWKLSTAGTTPERALARRYRALMSHLTDLGAPRTWGETRGELSQRPAATATTAGSDVSPQPLRLPLLMQKSALRKGSTTETAITKEVVKDAAHSDWQYLASFSPFKRILAFINPRSLAHWIQGRL